MRTFSALVCSAVLGLAACGGSGDEETAAMPAGSEPAAEEDAGSAMAGNSSGRPAVIRVARSDFGRMLFDSHRQAIYVFERDPKGRSVCYGDCARAWPPVFTDGRPVAGKGVKASLLGTIERRGGRRQVTYAGKPLYFYAHEGRGEVRCHNVNLNGGFWWVVGPDGKRRP